MGCRDVTVASAPAVAAGVGMATALGEVLKSVPHERMIATAVAET